MVFMRSHLVKAEKGTLSHPAERFVADFTRLITDVDRLMVDIGSTTEQGTGPWKSNGEERNLTLNRTVSALREHAQSFAKSVRHFELLYNQVPVPFIELDAKARIVGINEECAEILNVPATSVPGKSLFSFVAASDIKRLKESLTAASQNHKSYAVHLSLLKGGKSCPVGMRIRRHVNGSGVGYLAAVERANHLPKPNGAAKTQGTEHLPWTHELSVDLSRAAHIRAMADIVGNYCNKAFGSRAVMIFAVRNGNLQIVSQWPAGQIPAQQLMEEMIRKGPVARAFRTGEPVLWRQDRMSQSNYGFPHRLLRRFRSRCIGFLPMCTSEQHSVGVLAIAIPDGQQRGSILYNDLVRLGQIVSGHIVRAHIYDEALDARVKAETAVQTKDEFLSVLSHELKNPMMPILGWAVALSSGTLPEDKQNLALEGIVRNIKALNYLIEDLFDTARIASGKLRLQLSEIRIQDIAREALTAIQHAVESKKLRVSTDISEAIPPFTADCRRLHQVLINILNNAVKFTPSGGSIALQVRRRGHHVECVVSDTGKGIEREFLPLVFDRFRQENRSSNARAAGLGLGLAIVREIVELHGGSIKACSEGTDKGATFILQLPIRKRHSRSSRPPSGDESQVALRKKMGRHPK